MISSQFIAALLAGLLIVSLGLFAGFLDVSQPSETASGPHLLQNHLDVRLKGAAIATEINGICHIRFLCPGLT
jgi:hypothetical protein